MDIPALPTANSFCSQLYIYTHTHTSQEPDTSLKNVLKTSNALSQLITFESFNVNNSMCLFCRFFIKVHRPILKKKKDIWGSNNPEVKKILIRKKCFLHKDNISILAKRKCLFSRKKKRKQSMSLQHTFHLLRALLNNEHSSYNLLSPYLSH